MINSNFKGYPDCYIPGKQPDRHILKPYPELLGGCYAR